MRKKSYLVGIVLVCLLLAACGKQVETATPFVTITATQVPTGTQTPVITETAVPDLPFSGIYRQRSYQNHLNILNNSLHNWETVEFPEGSHVWGFEESLSPDHEWLVFLSGSVDDGDLALNVINLTDRQIIKVADLLSERYPDDLLEITDQLIYVDPENPNPELNPVNISQVLSEFEFYLGEYAWSPDGRYLAFIGQIDGQSLDLYVYDFSKNELARITADEKLIGRIEWSPDGEKIVFEHIMPGNPIDYRTLHIADLSDRNLSYSVSYCEGGLWYTSGWLSDHQLITTKTNDAAPNTGMVVLDVDTGQLTTIWPYYYFESAVNIEDQTVLFGGYLDFDYDTYEEVGAGLYFLEADGNWEFVREEGYPEFSIWPYSWNGEGSDYIIRIRNSLYSYSRENGLSDLITTEDTFWMEFSPDRRWLVLWNIEPTLVIGPDERLAYEIPELLDEVVWGPNSDGLFYLDDGWLKYITLLNGEVTTLEPCPNGECWIFQGQVVWFEN